MIFLRGLILFGLVLVSLPSYTQTECWGDVTISNSISEKVTLFGDVGSRKRVNDNQTFIFYIRPSASYRFNSHLQASGGAAWFYNDTDGTRVNELRGWQGFKVEGKFFTRISWNNYLRLEERWFYDPGYLNFSLRLRYLAGISIPINHGALLENTWYIPISYEIFEDLNDHKTIFINRMRTYVGVGYAFSKSSRLEVHYIANEGRSITNKIFENVNVFRVKWLMTIP